MGDFDGVGQVAGALVTVALVDRVLNGPRRRRYTRKKRRRSNSLLDLD